MTLPWIDIEEYQDPDSPRSRVYSEIAWQALFAFQVEVPSHQVWARLKWGLNVAMLFEEAQERQRLFLESQYAFPDEFGLEAANRRTLALRFVHRPGEGLLVTIVGKIHGRSHADVLETASSYYKEIKSTFPYDYSLSPAFSQDEFCQISGKDILDDTHYRPCMAQIRRREYPVYLKSSLPCIQGFWRSAPRAHEQIWRSIAASSAPLLMNVSLRSTILFEDEREGYRKIVDEIPGQVDQPLNQLRVSDIKKWNQETLERRLAPWKKFFYLQVHLASPQKLSDDLFRTIGTSLTQNNKGAPLPGYQVILPGQDERENWRKKLNNLDIIFSNSFLQHTRLSEVADLEEVFDALQLPYSPPDNGFPGLSFVTVRETPNPNQAPT